jgi:hypothetical protein
MMRLRLSGGFDMILLVYSETAPDHSFRKTAFSDREKQLEFLFTKAGLLK